MKSNSNILILSTIIAWAAGIAVTAMPGNRDVASGTRWAVDDDTTTIVTDGMRWLPGEIRDTAQFFAELQPQQQQHYGAKINVMARAYGDSVVLRWAADDYVSWRYLNRVGVNIIRMDKKTYDEDTIALGLKPATLEQFRARYPESDSLAGMAMGALYGEGMMTQEQTKDEAGSMGSLYEISQEQQLQYGIALLTSEWRQDLGQQLALRYTDRTAKKGRSYTYLVFPTLYDSTRNVVISAGMCDSVLNERTKPLTFDVELADSISYPNGIYITWPDKLYSSYEIERRKQGTGQWTRLNQHPYIIMNAVPGADCFYSDHVDEPGTYEYRVMAHDPFGELTEPSQVHSVTISDMTPPMPPRLTWIEIDRRNEQDPGKDIYATIHFAKDTLEEDLAGFVPMYYHERITEGQWRPLIETPLAPTDTMVTIDVTNLTTGQITIAAYDKTQNVSYAIPQLLRVTDMTPPMAPQHLTATPSIAEADTLPEPIGLITLTWHPVDNDDIDYYEVVFANDSTHEFMTQKHGIVTGDTVFVDTVAIDVNQKYIYYKVRAIDYSSNIGEFSEMLQVVRPSAIPPTVAHLDSTYIDGKGIFMRWIVGSDEQMAYHNVYRKLIDSDKEWTLLRRCDGDSVKACNNYIDLTDVPKVNADEEYVYAVESFNYSGISSGLSLQFCTRFTGDAVFEQPIKLYASYDQDKKQTHLAWETDHAPEGNDWYFCVWRQGPDDDRFKFLMSADANERDFVDYLLRPGQTAHYYIQIQMEDGRESEPSNIVTIKAPAKP